MIRINEQNLLTFVTAGSIVLTLFFSASGYILIDKQTALGIAAGGSIATVNFVWQRSIMQRVFGLQLSRPTMYASVRYLIRLFITSIVLYFVLTSGLFSLVGLLVGLSVVVMMILVCTGYFVIQHKGE